MFIYRSNYNDRFSDAGRSPSTSIGRYCNFINQTSMFLSWEYHTLFIIWSIEFSQQNIRVILCDINDSSLVLTFIETHKAVRFNFILFLLNLLPFVGFIRVGSFQKIVVEHYNRFVGSYRYLLDGLVFIDQKRTDKLVFWSKREVKKHGD